MKTNGPKESTESLITILKNAARSKDKNIVFINSSVSSDSLSYNELYDEAISVLGSLQKRGLKEGDELLLQVDSNRDFVLLFWACLMGKIIPVPLSYSSNYSQFEKFFNVWGVMHNPFLIADTNIIKKLSIHAEESGREYDSFTEKIILIADLYGEKEKGTLSEVKSDDLAYVQFSSGSTGSPKGVSLTHRNLLANINDIMVRSELSDTDKLLSWMPLTHDMGLICFHLTGVLSGIDQYVMPTSLFIKRPVLWMEMVDRHSISVIYSPNFGYQYFLMSLERFTDAKVWNFDQVRLIYNGAEPLSYVVISQFLEKMALYNLPATAMFPGYGLAEASVAVTLPSPGTSVIATYFERSSLRIGEKAIVTQTPTINSSQLVALGQPVDSTSVRICDGQDHQLDDLFAGHVQIRGENVTNGYYNNHKETLIATTEDGWIRTGDIGLFYQNNLYITGRYKDVIIINGQNYFPSDLENMLIDAQQRSGTLVVAGFNDYQRDKNGVVVFTLFKGKPKDFQPVSRKIKNTLIEKTGLIAIDVVPVRKIPKTTSGKVQRYQLLGQYQKGEYNEIIRSVDGLSESIMNLSKVELLQFAKETFGIEQMNFDTVLSDLGLNSLKAIEFCTTLRNRHGYQISIQDLFENLDLNDIWDIISKNQIMKADPVRKICDNREFELTAIQKRFWFQNKPDSHGNNPLHLIVSFQLSGLLDIKKLREAFSLLVERHESLRTTIIIKEGQPRQQVIENFPPVTVNIFQRGDEIVTAEDVVGKELKTGFVIENELPIRVSILPQDTKLNLLFITVHHLQCDGWSLSVIVKELSEIYNCLVNDVPVDLAPMAFQARDCYLWKQKELEKNADQHKKYWSEYLRDYTALQLPSSAGDSKFDGHRDFDVYQHDFDTEDFIKLQFLVSETNSTLYLTVLSLLNILLSRMVGQSDFTVGTDTSGRIHPDFTGQVGCFIENIILRTKLGRNDSFRELVDQMRRSVIDGLEHQSYPIENIASDLNTNTSDLFNTLILFQDYDAVPKLTNIISSVPEQHLKSGLLDLTFDFSVTGEGISLKIIYNKELFDRDHFRDFTKYFIRLINLVHTEADAPLSTFELLDHDSRLVHVAQYCKAPKFDFLPIHTQFERIAAVMGSNIAIVDNELSLTYKDLSLLVTKVSCTFSVLYDLKPGDRIGLEASGRYETVIIMLAAMTSGITYVPINADLPPKRREFMIAETGVSYIFSEKFNDDASGYTSVNFRTLLASAGDVEMVRDETKSDPEATAYIMYTSGSTGAPKGVIVKYHSVSSYVDTFRKYFNLTASDVVMQQASLSFDTSVEEIFPVLCSGGKLVIHRKGGRDLDGLIDLIDREQITLLSTVPSVIREINNYHSRLDSLKILISGGEVLYPSYYSNLIDKMSVYNTYGPTEATVCCTYKKVDNAFDLPSLGAVIPNSEVYILDAYLNLQPAGFIGQIAIGGNGVAQGYLNEADLTSEKFIDHPLHKHGKLFLTGDYGRWTSSQEIRFSGRKDDQVKLNGQRVHLKEIESAMMKHPLIEQVAIKVWNRGEGGSQLIAFYQSHGEVSEVSLTNFLAGILPLYMVPAKYSRVDKFRLNASGKLDLSAFSETEPELQTDTETESEPGNSTEIVLLELWQNELKEPNLRVNSNFFGSGGNSINAFRLCSAIARKFGCDVSYDMFYTYPTVKKFAEAICGSDESISADIPLTTEKEFYRCSHAQERLWLKNEIDDKGIENNLHWIYELTGRLDISLFEKACRSLVEKHEVLRTSIFVKDGKLWQKINPPSYMLFNVVNSKSEEQLQNLLDAQSEKKLDVSSDPVFQVIVFRIAEAHHVISIFTHHLAVDGWSTEILESDLMKLYRQEVTVDLQRKKTIRYIDYSDWERNYTESSRSVQAKDFWIEKLSGQFSVKTLPSDDYVSGSRFKNQSLKYEFGAELKTGIPDFCSLYRLSYTQLLSMALAILIRSKNETKEDIFIGLMSHGRSNIALHDTVGFFVNVLPQRFIFDEEQALDEWIEALTHDYQDMMKFQNYPYQQLIDSSQEAVFKIAVSSVFENNHTPMQLPEVDVKRRSNFRWRNDYDATFALIENQKRFELNILFDGTTYSDKGMEQYCIELETIINRIIVSGKEKLASVLSYNDAANLNDSVTNYLKEYNGNTFLAANHDKGIDVCKRLIPLNTEHQEAIRRKAIEFNVNPSTVFIHSLGLTVNRLKLEEQGVIGIADSLDSNPEVLVPLIIKSNSHKITEVLKETENHIANWNDLIRKSDHSSKIPEMNSAAYDLLVFRTYGESEIDDMKFNSLLTKWKIPLIIHLSDDLTSACYYDQNRMSKELTNCFINLLSRTITAISTINAPDAFEAAELTAEELEEIFEQTIYN